MYDPTPAQISGWWSDIVCRARQHPCHMCALGSLCNVCIGRCVSIGTHTPCARALFGGIEPTKNKNKNNSAFHVVPLPITAALRDPCGQRVRAHFREVKKKTCSHCHESQIDYRVRVPGSGKTAAWDGLPPGPGNVRLRRDGHRGSRATAVRSYV